MAKQPSPWVVRLPEELRARADAAVRSSGLSRNAWMLAAIDVACSAGNPEQASAVRAQEAKAVVVEDEPDAFEVQWRQVASRVQWRVTAGGVEYAGAVAFKRDVLPAARETLTQVLGHPVQVTLAR